MPKLELELEVYCACGEGLCHQTEGHTPGRGMPFVTVESCQKCLDAAWERGYAKGYDEGILDAEEKSK